MIRDSEKTGEKGCDPNLYRAALRYVAALFSTTDAFNYVRILADLAISFHCSSDMETTVWDAFVFTQQTVNDKRIWSDQGVEWLLKDVRAWLLKHARPNQEALLTRLVLNLVDKKRSRMAGGESSKAKTDSGERKENSCDQSLLSIKYDRVLATIGQSQVRC
jgi:hypothetical protein